MAVKYVFVTGGVVSGLGKGITAASLGRLLKARGYTVTMQKFDPYINIDPGTMNPVQHGEVFVTDDGAETDLDLGHYERFIDESRFARYFVNDKLRFNKWGRVKINYEMQRKGIPSSIRSEALEGIDEQEYRSILLSLLKSKKKVTRGKDDREVYAKLLRFAAGRGFETRETSRCLKQLFNGNDYEDDFE